MKLPVNSIEHIKNELKSLDKGEIIIELNDTRNKIDIQTISGDPVKVDSLIQDIQKAAADIHHGKLIIKKEDVGGNIKITIGKVKRERFPIGTPEKNN